MKQVSFLLLAAALITGTAFSAEQSPAPVAKGHDTHAHGTQAPEAGAPATDAFARMDTNQDGFLSKTELARHPMAGHAVMVDADKDGRLSRSEFKALESM
jgi:hypothetical protein